MKALDRARGFSETFKKLAEAEAATAGKCTILIEVKPPESGSSPYKSALEYLFEKEARLVFCSNAGVINQLFDAIQAADGKYDGVIFAGYDDGTKTREWMSSVNISIIYRPAGFQEVWQNLRSYTC